MTFKEFSRNELLSVLPNDECCIKAFLSAYSKCAGYIEGTGRRQTLCVNADSLDAANKIAEMFARLYPIQTGVTKYESDGTNKTLYKVSLPNGFAKQALIDFELMRESDSGYVYFTHAVPQELLRKQCCMSAYFKGLYLACGSVYAPILGDDDGKKKQSYHFELDIDDAEFADSVMEFLSDLRINTRMSDRSSHKLIYVKACDEIVQILCALELVESAAKLRAVIGEREVANLLNRAVICETANMDKVFATASKQMIIIAKIRDMGRFESLPTALKDTAEMRAKYPEASLQELADLLEVSKSCLRHRFDKLENIANGIDN